MSKWIFSSLLTGVFVVLSFAQSTAPQADVEQILKQARAAIGPETRLSSITSLSVSGPTRRMMGEVPVTSDMEYLVLMPDKFRRNEVRHPFTTITVVEGDTSTIKRVPTDMALGNTANSLIRESNDPQVQARRLAAQRNEFSRFMLGWFLHAPSYNPVEYSLAGESTEEGKKMLMIDAKGQGNFQVRLYLDQKTYQIQMMTFRGRKLVEVLNAMRNAPEIRELSQQDESKLTGQQKQERQALLDKWRKEFQEAVAKAPIVEIRWRFGNFKKVDGLNLPHYLSRSEDGEMFEEWEINQFKLNPKLLAAAFDNR